VHHKKRNSALFQIPPSFRQKIYQANTPKAEDDEDGNDNDDDSGSANVDDKASLRCAEADDDDETEGRKGKDSSGDPPRQRQ